MFSKAKQKAPAEDNKSKARQKKDASVAISAPAPSSRRGASPMKSGVPSIISADVMMRGNLTSNGEVQLDGALEGDIKAAVLIVGQHASVKGEIVCESVTIRGRVEGAIRAKQVSLASTAHIEGDILHSALSVESGAHFEGNCRHSDDPLSESASKDFRKTRPSGGAPRPANPSAASNDGNLAARAASSDAPSFLSQSRSPLR